MYAVGKRENDAGNGMVAAEPPIRDMPTSNSHAIQHPTRRRDATVGTKRLLSFES